MKASPIQVRRVDLLSLNVEINEEWSFDKPSGWDTDLSGLEMTEKVDLGDLVWSDKPPKLTGTVRLSISVSEGAGKSLPHRIAASAAALIEVMDAATKQDLIDHLLVNGCAVLYSTIREQVLSVTSRTPFGPFNLPTVNFMDLRGNTTAQDLVPCPPIPTEPPGIEA
jgi:preprotein translocase subunit SecB